jgi:glycosyltransferase involved in cell wall biosynthesis
MIILLSVTAFIILLYLAYPVWLAMNSPVKEDCGDGNKTIEGVSLALLSFNGSHYLKEKIEFLLKELSVFKACELIIIDDHSEDGSREILEAFLENKNITLFIKEVHKGIPDSMNLAVKIAKYDYIVFCDQRQHLSVNIIKRLVEPLNMNNIGAVSACISDHDKSHYCSRIRSYENYIKCQESRTGNLIGVYGPLYAIKKSCYSPIPEYIILDDLYLSLKILAGSQVKLMKECLITDENPSLLNDYQRAKRYILGFLQLINERGLISRLSARQKIMLIWHKYLRLLIPVLLLTSYACLGIMSFREEFYFILFIIITVFACILLLPARMKIHYMLNILLKTNIFYFFAILEVGISHFILRKSLSLDHRAQGVGHLWK